MVAVKVLDAPFARNSLATARFVQESRAAVEVRHPNVVDVLDAGSDAAHDRGLVHWDVKPENVLLHVASGGDVTATLLDFGICKLRPPSEGAARLRLTLPGTILGTPHCLSPGQAYASANVDARTDVWSAGVLLYRMLVGHEPFDAPTLPALLERVAFGTPATPVALMPATTMVRKVRLIHLRDAAPLDGSAPTVAPEAGAAAAGARDARSPTAGAGAVRQGIRRQLLAAPGAAVILSALT